MAWVVSEYRKWQRTKWAARGALAAAASQIARDAAGAALLRGHVPGGGAGAAARRE